MLLGISGCQKSFTLNFPENESLGELSIIEDVNCFTCGTGEEQLGNAVGNIKVTLPADRWFVHLDLPEKVSHLLFHLESPSLSKINSLDLTNSDINDDDLKYLSGLYLERIDLAGTAITGEGLRYLKPNKFFWLNVEETPNLNLQNLAVFQEYRGINIQLGDPERLELAKKLFCSEDPTLCKRQIIQLR